MNQEKVIDLSVLVIDDQRTMRSIVRQLLHQEGITDVSEAENGAQAIEKLIKAGRRCPDVVVCDLYMDDMDGSQFTNAVRRNKAGIPSDTPIIILTGSDDDFVLEVTAQVGATKILKKPVTSQVLRENIENVVGYKL